MTFSDFITKCRESKSYFRGLVIRAIEDAIILFIFGFGIWAVCWTVTAALRLLGVA